MHPVLKKMLFKGQSPVLVMNAPREFAPIAKAFGVPIHSTAKAHYRFVLVFAKSLEEAASLADQARPALEESALFWLGYPKGTSKNYKKLDINRDLVNARLAQHGFEGVA